MADSLWVLLKRKEADVLIRKALALSEETLGPDHPLTLGIVARLAGQLYEEDKDRPASFKMRERVWKGHQRLYGDDSNITLISLGYMAIVHESPAEAERLLKEGIERAKRISGKMSNLIMTLEDRLADYYGAKSIDGRLNPGFYSYGEATEFCRLLVKVEFFYSKAFFAPLVNNVLTYD
jgi:hypothetical protein